MFSATGILTAQNTELAILNNLTGSNNPASPTYLPLKGLGGIALGANADIYFALSGSATPIGEILYGGALTGFEIVGIAGDGDTTVGPMAIDSSGNIYYATDSGIVKKAPGQSAAIFAGSTTYQQGWADGVGTAALFGVISGMTVDSSGNLYVTDNGAIRKITPAADVTTIAGNYTASAGSFANPSGIAVDGSSNLYVADTLNHTIRKILPNGTVTTLAGTAGVIGSANGTGAAASFRFPKGVAVDSAGNIYVADTGNLLIRMITPAGVVTTLAGSGSASSAIGSGARAIVSPAISRESRQHGIK